MIARQALFTYSDGNGVTADTTDSGLPLLSARDLSDFNGQPMTVMLAAPVDDGGELRSRAQSLLREAAWFARDDPAPFLALCLGALFYWLPRRLLGR